MSSAKWILLLALVCYVSFTFAQPQKGEMRILVKGGIDSYGGGFTGFAGGGGSSWKNGPILGAGVEYQAGRVVSILGIVEYSAHAYNPAPHGPTYLGDPQYVTVDLSANTKFLLSPIYFLAGISACNEHTDEVDFVRSDGSTGSHPRSDKFHVAGNLGLGLTFPLGSRFTVFGEGSLRFRFYVAPVAEVGLSYLL